jgi:hypothetical protein
MKKIIFAFSLLIATGVGLMSFKSTSNSYLSESNEIEEAFPAWLAALLGIEVDYVRGMRQETSSGSVECLGRGMCSLHVGAGGITQSMNGLLGKPHSVDHSFAGFDDLGNMFILVFNPGGDEWRGTTFIMDGDFAVPLDLAAKFGKASYVIKKGSYIIERDASKSWVAVRFMKR